MSANSDVARRIRFERRAREWSVAELAQRSGLSVTSLTNIERRPGSVREGKQITVEELLAVAAALGVPPSLLLGCRCEAIGAGA